MSFEYIVRTYGYLGLFLGTFFEGETILIVGGFTAHLGYLKLPWVMLFAFLGAFSGDQLFFFIGRYKGRTLLSRFPKLQIRVDKVHKAIERYHDLIILGFRFVYGIRILTPFVLGLDKGVKVRRFLVFNTLGALIWSVAVSLGGFFSGAALQILIEDIRHYELEAILGMCLIGLTLWAIHRYRGQRSLNRDRQEGPASDHK
jgi:membrane protein DedA with SNARE-associated domain